MLYLTMPSLLLWQPCEVDLITQTSALPWPTASLCIDNLGAELSTFLDFLKRIHLQKAGVSTVDFAEDFCWELEEVVYFVCTMENILDISILYFIRYFCSLSIPCWLYHHCVVFSLAAPIFAFFLSILTLSYQFQVSHSYAEQFSSVPDPGPKFIHPLLPQQNKEHCS